MNRRLFKAYLFKEQFEHAWTYTPRRACAISSGDGARCSTPSLSHVSYYLPRRLWRAAVGSDNENESDIVMSVAPGW